MCHMSSWVSASHVWSVGTGPKSLGPVPGPGLAGTRELPKSSTVLWVGGAGCLGVDDLRRDLA